LHVISFLPSSWLCFFGLFVSFIYSFLPFVFIPSLLLFFISYFISFFLHLALFLSGFHFPPVSVQLIHFSLPAPHRPTRVFSASTTRPVSTCSGRSLNPRRTASTLCSTASYTTMVT
jgi:hypothetical protein